jgi:tryptophan 7-halogenase
MHSTASGADRVERIVIVGGGAAGWLAAATLARVLKSSICSIRLIDVAGVDAGGTSETALPSFHRLNALLGIDEYDLVRKTQATFKLGTRFVDWGRLGESYMHAFGSVGAKLDAVAFHHYWIKLHLSGESVNFDAYSTAAAAAAVERFGRPVPDRQSMLSLYSYGYHFHAGLLAAYLREFAEAHGVIRVDRTIVDVPLRAEDGFIHALKLDDGSSLRADLYIDCTGSQGLLCRQALKTPDENWSQWLPCDRVIHLPVSGSIVPGPYAEAVADCAGWRSRTPMQHALDAAYVYSSAHVGDDEAAATLRATLPGTSRAEAKLHQFSPGRPRQFWNKNCLSLTGSNLEPLESTALHRVQTGISRLITLFPVSRYSPPDIEEYNRLTVMEHERIRDFLILHYKCTQRVDTPFWEQCRHMAIPATAQAKIELFRRCGRIALLDEEHFGEDSWLSLFIGQHVIPEDYDPLADVLDVADVRAALSKMRSMIDSAVATLPTHRHYLDSHCRAAPVETVA